MDAAHINMFRKLLLDQQMEQINLKDESITCERLPDPLDAAIDDNEKTLNTHFISRKKLFLSKIENALQKIEDDTYGECEGCGDDIGTKRLLARPTATLCLECKREKEAFERREKERSKGGTLDASWDS